MSRNVAVVGCGHWGKNLVRNFSQLQALRSVCDTNEGILAANAHLAPGAALTTSFADILADEEVRAVVLATPPALHVAQAREALLAGKDVFVEKPLALGYADGREVVELARSRGAILMVGHVLEYHPAVVLLKKLVADGELGKLWYVYSNRLNLGKVRREENILWSFAPHDISVISSLVGAEPASVATSGGNYLQSGIFDLTVTNLTFDNGVRGHIFVSWLHPYKEQKLVVIGERKMAVFDDTVRDGKLKIYDKGIEWHEGLPIPRQTSETTLFFDDREPLRIECEHFLACVRERRRPLTDGESALRVLNVLEGGQVSLERGGAPVSLAGLEKSEG